MTLLFLCYQGAHHVTAHPDDENAWRSLMEFVDAKLAQQPQSELDTLTEAERARLLFSDPEDLYVLAEVHTADHSH